MLLFCFRERHEKTEGIGRSDCFQWALVSLRGGSRQESRRMSRRLLFVSCLPFVRLEKACRPFILWFLLPSSSSSPFSLPSILCKHEKRSVQTQVKRQDVTKDRRSWSLPRLETSLSLLIRVAALKGMAEWSVRDRRRRRCNVNELPGLCPEPMEQEPATGSLI